MDELEAINAERQKADAAVDQALAGNGDLQAALAVRMEIDRRHAELMRTIVHVG